MFLPALYSQRSDGGTQGWTVEIEGNKYRTHSGVHKGAIVVSEWTVCEGKNIGRANETTPEQQALAEAQAKWTKKKEAKYTENIADIETDRIFQPMLAKNFEDRLKDLFKPDGSLKQILYSQPKLDGIRCLATKDGLYSRNGKKFVACPHIEAALAPIFAANPDVILDGELYNHELKDNFNKIVSCVKRTKPSDEDIQEARQVQYHVYDLASSPNSFYNRQGELSVLWVLMNYTNNPLNNNLPDYPIVRVETTVVSSLKDLDFQYARYVEDGYEGQMVRLDKPYENKRSATLLKRKEWQDGEFKILDVVEGVGNRTGTAGYMVIELPNGTTQKSNIKGEFGLIERYLLEKDQLIGKMATI
jgi:DNA ligase-1